MHLTTRTKNEGVSPARFKYKLTDNGVILRSLDKVVYGELFHCLVKNGFHGQEKARSEGAGVFLAVRMGRGIR